MQKKTFREDINGLRALAVLSVVVFHFSPQYAPGGFAGVDVFFVISGFLMTSIIFRGIEHGDFSIVKFITSRAKRIIPALMAVIFVMLIIGFLFIEPKSYQLLGKHSASSLLFISNIIYSMESGYFDVNSSSKLLLHTWSLSVEWQFYILYPIIVYIVAKKTNIKIAKIAVILIAAISLASCVYMSNISKVNSYFMIYTRAWEMAAGGIAFFYKINAEKSHKKYFELLGIILIILSFFLFSSTTPWPSYNAMLPVLGTFICISVNNEKSLLSCYALQKIGLLSYSIYLIHWPVMALLDSLAPGNGILTKILITVVLSVILYATIERKRKYSKLSIAIYIIILSLSVYVSINGIKSRIPDGKYNLTSQEFMRSYFGGATSKNDGNVHYYNTKYGEAKFILTGDSLSRQYVRSLEKKKIPFILISKDGCFSTKNYYTKFDKVDLTNDCIHRYEKLVNEMNKNKKIDIIYLQYWRNNYANDNEVIHRNGISKPENIMIDEIENLISDGGSERNYYLIGKPQSSVGYSYFDCKAKSQLPIFRILGDSCTTTRKRNDSPPDDILIELANRHNNVFYINPNDPFCDENNCSLSTKDGEPVYADEYHLTTYAADIVIMHILEKIK